MLSARVLEEFSMSVLSAGDCCNTYLPAFIATLESVPFCTIERVKPGVCL